MLTVSNPVPVFIILFLWSLFFWGCNEQTIPVSPIEDIPWTFSSPDLSVNNVVVYSDFGYRKNQNNWSLVDSLVGIWIYDVGTLEKTKIIDHGQHPKWSPNGELISYWYNNEIWLFNLFSGEHILVVDDSSFNNPPRWGECNKVVFSSSRGASFDYTIWAYNLDSAELSHLTPGQDGLRNPTFFSQCDSLIARSFFQLEGQTWFRVSTLDLHGQFIETILETQEEIRGVTSSSDGNLVGYHSVVGGESRIRVVSRNGSQVLVSNVKGSDVSFTPGDSLIIYVGEETDPQSKCNSDLKIFDLKNGETLSLQICRGWI